MSKTFQSMIRVAIIFALPAIAAYNIGGWIDEKWNSKPIGSLIVLGIAFVLSWTIVIRMYLKMDKSYRESIQDEEKEDEVKKL